MGMEGWEDGGWPVEWRRKAALDPVLQLAQRDWQNRLNVCQLSMLQQTVERSAAVDHTEENPPTGKSDRMEDRFACKQGSCVPFSGFVGLPTRYKENNRRVNTKGIVFWLLIDMEWFNLSIASFQNIMTSFDLLLLHCSKRLVRFGSYVTGQSLGKNTF